MRIALQYLGVPYVWGGADPLTGFDCSGLTMYVYAQLGIQLTHYTGSQFYEGTRIPPWALRPGDLVFFEPSSRGPQHEGMYIGGGRFIQARHGRRRQDLVALGARLRLRLRRRRAALRQGDRPESAHLLVPDAAGAVRGGDRGRYARGGCDRPGDPRHRVLSNVVEDFALPFVALVVLLAAAILGRRALASFRAEGPQPLPSWRLAALPALGFLGQEYAEQLVHDGRLAALTALEPLVVIGVVLQLALGVPAIWLVRTLLRAAEQLGCTLAARGPRWARRAQRLRVRPFQAPEPRLPVLASQHAGRAPPAVA